MTEKRTPRPPSTWDGVCPGCERTLKAHEAATLVLHQGLLRPVCHPCRNLAKGQRT